MQLLYCRLGRMPYSQWLPYVPIALWVACLRNYRVMRFYAAFEAACSPV